MIENDKKYQIVPTPKPSAPTPAPTAAASDVEMADGNIKISLAPPAPSFPVPEPISQPLELHALVHRVSETVARDLSRMQMQKSLYTEYRTFTLIHAGKDQPVSLKAGEVSCVMNI